MYQLADSFIALLKADLSNSSDVKRAVQGSSVVFGVTDFWTTMSDEIEIMQGQNIADACKFHAVDHLIFSSLVYVSRGKFLQPRLFLDMGTTHLMRRCSFFKHPYISQAF